MSVDVTPYRRTGRLDGRCLCGAVTIVVDGAHVAAVGACHCAMCRRWSGTVLSGFDAAPDAVTVTGTVTRHASSDFAERAFCPECGSHLWFRLKGADSAYELAPGLFDGAAAFPLISEIFTDTAHRSARLAGDHPTRTRAEWEAANQHVEGDGP